MDAGAGAELAAGVGEPRSRPGLVEAAFRRIELGLARGHIAQKHVHRFGWGLEHLGLDPDSQDPAGELAGFTGRHLESSADYFVPETPDLSRFELEGDQLSFPSPIATFHRNNDTVRGDYFPSERGETAIVIVPHWNARPFNRDRIARTLARMGYSALWLSLPFHGERGADLPPEWATHKPSTHMVSANIGLTLLAVRQAVQDALAAVHWLLETRGYARVAMFGASIGSCVCFLAAAHEPRVRGLFANLMSSHFGDAVWTGVSTSHIRESVEPHLDQPGLRDAWLMNSPIAFAGAVRQHNPELRLHILSGRFDSTFEFHLTERIVDALDREGLDFRHTALPCGHYTLGAPPFSYFGGLLALRFFRRLARG